MNVLLIKTSSMGDIIHTLPALTDAGNAIPGIKFDWVVEQPFAAIPTWHPLVERTIPVAIRKWRKELFTDTTRVEWREIRERLQAKKYDLVIDAQGLMKSAFLTYFTRGTKVGLNWGSARESMASLAYHRKLEVKFKQHAIHRMRSLMSQALSYPLPASKPVFGLPIAQFRLPYPTENYIVFLHGTTWTSKQWPEKYWRELATLVTKHGLDVKISGGNKEERARAARIAEGIPGVDVVPFSDIPSMTALMAGAKAAVAVDTGFGHMAAALAIPTLSIYGSTNANFTGVEGALAENLSVNFPCAPCMKRVCRFAENSVETFPPCYTTTPPLHVWEILQHKI